MADPTEMIRSDEIDPLLRSEFEVLDYRPLYGNLLCPLVNALRPAALGDDLVRDVLDEAILLERELEGTSVQPLFAIYLLRRACHPTRLSCLLALTARRGSEPPGVGLECEARPRAGERRATLRRTTWDVSTEKSP